jgi:dTDP-4-dehydrorhamnose 3,5-epimerase
MRFPEVKIYEPSSFHDYRGELYTLFDQKKSDLVFNHDKVSRSSKNVLRGLHGDSKSWKLISCVAGSVYFVVVDNRISSPNYMKWDWTILSAENKKTVIVPPNFANGHYVLSDEATFFYKWSYEGEYPDVDSQFTIKWNDKDIGINWPTDNPILSKRDK